MITEEIRSYEVSIWTLQDEFITVLKWSDVEHKGRIQDPAMKISDDGMQEFSFSIPMYYDDGRGTLIENPIWYNTRNGVIMVNLRKIKVIYNKQTSDEQVFEFIISKITETHEKDILTCNISCDGLPFHELGKIGYQYSLSYDDYVVDYDAAKREGKNCPATVQYWCEKVNLLPYPTNGQIVNPRKWYYVIDMNWSSFEDGIERRKDIVYEEMYTSSWQLNNITNEVYPKTMEAAHEKERIVEAKESNLYNITQEIAKQFGIYCRYEYDYDDNYHIIGKKVIYFNNYLHDTHILHLTYPYSSKKVTREIDSTDIVTKMYVRSMQDDSTYYGESNINYCKANKMQENYIFNFDYLKDTDAITKEQQDAIVEYENEIFRLNSLLMPLYDKKAAYEEQKIKLEAKIAVYTNSIGLAQEQIDSNSALALELIAKYASEKPTSDSDPQYQYISTVSGERLIIQADKSGVYYINLTNLKKGIQADTIRLYRTMSSTTRELSDEIDRSEYYFKYDEYGNPTTIYGVVPSGNSSIVYATFQYIPELYYDSIIKSWKQKMWNDGEALRAAQAELNSTENPKGIKVLLDEIDTLIEETEQAKYKYISSFNELMGPALREGYWQPENYQDYSEQHAGICMLTTKDNTTTDNFKSVDTEDNFQFGWDTELFDTEQTLYYRSSVDEAEKIYYPCINLSASIEETDGFTTKTAFDAVQELLNGNLPVSVFFNNNCYNPPMTEQEYNSILNKREGQEFYIYDDNNVLHHYIYHVDPINDNDPLHHLEEVTLSNNPVNIRSFTIGSEAILAWAKTSTNNIYPILILTGAKNMSQKELQFMYAGGNLSIGTIQTAIVNNNITLQIHAAVTVAQSDNFWNFDVLRPRVMEGDTLLKFNYDGLELVQPRLKFSSLMLKTNEGLYLNFNNHLLDNYQDYYINVRTTAEREYAPEYFVTIKPQTLFKYGNYGALINQSYRELGELNVDYLLSNASTAIYLDALKIAKENAFPKVSYTVEPNILDRKLLRTLYNKLNYLVIINDVQLKFQNVFGYISSISLDLDRPQNDTIELKNYTSKFEDLFSQIIAQTEQMQRNENLLGPISRGVYSLSPTGLISTLENNTEAVVNFLKENFLTSDAMTQYMSSIFLDASNILSESNNHESYVLSSENSSILNGFAQQVQNGIVATIFRQETMPTEFKQGDIWIQISSEDPSVELARYSATCNSNIAKEGYGWVKTYGGSYAEITGQNGASIDIASGLINLNNVETANIQNTISQKFLLIDNNESVNTLATLNTNGLTIGQTTGLDSLGGALANITGRYVRLNKEGLIIANSENNVNTKLEISLNNLLTIDTSVTGHTLMFSLGDKLKYYADDNLEISGATISVSMGSGSIGSWYISSDGLSNTNLIDNSTIGLSPKSNYPMLWAGGIYNATGNDEPKLKIMGDGSIYIKQLKVKTGSNPDQWSTIDLTTNFTDAVSYSSGIWDGETLNATVSLYSVLSKTLPITCNIIPTSVIATSVTQGLKTGLCTVNLTLNPGNTVLTPKTGITIDGTVFWDAGYTEGQMSGYDTAARTVTADDEYHVLSGEHYTFEVPTIGGSTKTIHIYGY